MWVRFGWCVERRFGIWGFEIDGGDVVAWCMISLCYACCKGFGYKAKVGKTLVVLNREDSAIYTCMPTERHVLGA